MAADAGGETDPDVIQALYDLEVAMGQRVLAGEKKEVDFSRLERGRVGAHPRDKAYLDAWNTPLPSVDFSGEALEDDLGYGQSHRAQMVERLRSSDYGDQSLNVRGEVLGRVGWTGNRSQGRGYTDSGYGGGYDRRNAFEGRNDEVGFAQAAYTSEARPAPDTDPASRQSVLRNDSPTRRIGRAGHKLRSPPPRAPSPVRRATSPVRWDAHGKSAARLGGGRKKGSSGGPTFKAMIEKAAKIEGTGAYGAGKKNEASKASETSLKTNSPTPTPRDGSSAASRRTPMVPGPQDVTASIRPVTRIQHPVGHLASPGEFMDNAHKVWPASSRHQNRDEAVASISDGAAATARPSSNEDDAGRHTPPQVTHTVACSTQKPESPTKKGKGKGEEPYPSRDSDPGRSNYELLCSQFPQLNPSVVRSFLRRSNGNLEDAKADLVKLQERCDPNPSSFAERTAAPGSSPSASNVQDEPDLIDLVDAPTVTPTEKPTRNIMDDDSLIVFQAEPPQPKQTHLLDDDFRVNVPIPWLRPALTSRSGNIPQSDAGDGIVTADNELLPLSTQLAKFSLSENAATPSNALRGTPTTQAARAAARSTTNTVFRGPDLTRSIWASENVKDGQSGSGRRRN
ncbi:hypothetical protein GP486_006295 [Trichoglossum hirsutum]|uniref:CUE domain-containing protein n=1 Tax=Trichoglossum hirsutum TaxID=265104 RepID=A0A9P8IK78_9PEZI|nr:hypothetical protein GP486_006295 [Trichoglossum hirsutum]